MPFCYVSFWRLVSQMYHSMYNTLLIYYNSICFASVIQIITCFKLDTTSPDVTWNFASIALWATVEVNLAVLAGNCRWLPLLTGTKLNDYSLPSITASYLFSDFQRLSQKHPNLTTNQPPFFIMERQIEASDEHLQRWLFRLHKTSCGYRRRIQQDLGWSLCLCF